MRYLSLGEVLYLHQEILASSGGATGVRDLGALEAALAQPRLTFEAEDLYPDIPAKGTALAYSLICNHPFVDGNKRVGHAALETFLVLNGYELSADVASGEEAILGVAAGAWDRSRLLEWVREHVRPRSSGRAG